MSLVNFFSATPHHVATVFQAFFSDFFADSEIIMREGSIKDFSHVKYADVSSITMMAAMIRYCRFRRYQSA